MLEIEKETKGISPLDAQIEQYSLAPVIYKPSDTLANNQMIDPFPHISLPNWGS